MVENKVAQYYKGRVRPLIFYDLEAKEIEFLFDQLKDSKGGLSRKNYHHFLPYLLPLGFSKPGYVVIDLEATAALKLELEENERNKNKKTR